MVKGGGTDGIESAPGRGKEKLKIRQLTIADFGIWHERTISLDAPVTIVYGANEAGKSTIHAFTRFMLFGFPPRAPVSELYASPRSSLLGGTMTLEDDAGRVCRIERYVRLNEVSGKWSDEKLHAVFPDGTSTHRQHTLSERLLGGMTPEVHRNIYAFSLDELRELSALESTEISGYLFSAGLGVAPGHILAAEKTLEQEMDRLYRPRGQNPALNAALREWSFTERALREFQARSGHYNELKERLAANEAARARAESERSRLNEEVNWLSRCIEAWEPWLRRAETEKALAAFPDFSDFPADALPRYERLLEKRSEAERRLSELEDELQRMRAETEAIRIDERLLRMHEPLREAIERLPVYKNDAALLAGLRHELDMTNDQLARALRQIDPAWKREQLLRFPATLAEQERARRLGNALTIAEERMQAQRAARRDAEERLRALERVMADREGAAADSELHEQWSSAEQELSRQLELSMQLDLRREHLLHNQESKDAVKFRRSGWFLGSVAAALSAGAFTWYAAQNEVPAYVFAFIGLNVFFVVAYAAHLIWRNKKDASDARAAMRELERKQAQVREDMEAILRKYGKADAAGDATGYRESAAALDRSAPSSLADVRERAQAAMERLRRERAMQEATRRQRDERAQEYEELQQRLLLLRREEDALAHAHAEAMQDWTAWLAEHELSRHTSALSLPQLFTLAEQAWQLLAQAERIEGRIDRLSRSMQDFEQHVCEMLELPDAEHLETELKRAFETAENERALAERLAEGRRKMAELENVMARQSDEIDQIRAELNKLMAEANAQSDEHFRRLVAEVEEFRKLQTEKRQLDFIVEHLAGENGITQMNETLQGQSEALLREALDDLRRQAASCTEEIRRLNEERGKLSSDLDRMQSDDEHADLLLKNGEQEAGVRQYLEQWAKRALALQLIRKTREKAERERQPQVMVKAGTYFERMSGGRYRRINAGFAERSIKAERADGVRVPIETLSRGTLEQLFLSIRFALADEHAGQIALPIWMDDIFVNFDRERLHHSLRVLNEMSRMRQIVLFTCHDHIVRAAENAISGLNTVRLGFESDIRH